VGREYPYPPRMMLRGRAAAYCDLTETEFEREVAAGSLPGPCQLGKKPHWDRRDLDEWLDRMAAGDEPDWRNRSNFYRKRHAA
jgi:predicted DNA-binding transcriptional regulator AlpA